MFVVFDYLAQISPWSRGGKIWHSLENNESSSVLKMHVCRLWLFGENLTLVQGREDMARTSQCQGSCWSVQNQLERNLCCLRCYLFGHFSSPNLSGSISRKNLCGSIWRKKPLWLHFKKKNLCGSIWRKKTFVAPFQEEENLCGFI